MAGNYSPKSSRGFMYHLVLTGGRPSSWAGLRGTAPDRRVHGLKAASRRNLCAAFFAAMLAAACLGAPGASGSEIILARVGMTEYAIAHGGSPEPAEITAAENLSKFLKKVTGAEFRIIGEDDVAPGGAAVYVGWTEHALREGINYRELGPEEWLVKTAGNDLIITGGRPAGTINGVFEFLETAAGVHFHCLSNRDVRDIFTEKLRSHLERRGDGPFPVYYNISQNDCLPWHCCLCPDCRKIVEREGAESGLLIDFIDGGGEPEARTEARALWSDKKLYLGFKCYEGRMEEMRYDSGGSGAGT